MPRKSRRLPVDSILGIAMASFCISPMLAGCAVGPPEGPLGPALSDGPLQVLLIVLVAVGIFILWNRKRHDAIPHADRVDTALSVLRSRYARGEIDRDDFLQRRRDLEERRTEEARGASTL